MAIAFSADLDGIAHVLRDRPLSVPAYQRAYSWTEEQVKAFWSDLLELHSGEPTESYFMGTIVLTKSDDRAQIVDGQQRLATVTMLLAVIRNAFLEHGDEQRAGVLERDYVAYASLKAATLEPRLRLGQDQDYFSALVVARPGPATPVSTMDSHERILRAFNLLTALLRAQLQDAGKNWSAVLFRWADLLETRVQVIVIEVTSSADAFTIFETLNDRGLALTVADLLKNYLFSLAGSKLPQIQEAWSGAVETLKEALDEASTINFLRHYWNSVHGATRERDLYRTIRSNVRTAGHAVELTKELCVAAPAYVALNNEDDLLWASLGPTGPRVAETLVTLGIEQNRPLLLAAFKMLAGPELLQLVDAVNGWSVRGIAVGGIGGGVAEKRYADAAVALRNAKSPTAETARAALETFIPSNEEFEESFSAFRPNRLALARYCLVELERHGHGTSAEDLDGAILSYVIAPHSDLWADGDESRRLSRRLGNMVLVEPDVHARVEEADDWAAKKREFGTSRFGTTKSLARIRSFDGSSIQTRQEAMAKQAPSVWPRTIG